MRARIAGLVVAVLLLGAVAPAARASLVVLDDQRYVSADGLAPIRPGPGESLFDASAVGAQSLAGQLSSFGAAGILGDGSVSSSGGTVTAQTVLELHFAVDALAAFTLSGSISEGSGASAFLADSNGVFHLLGPDLALTGSFTPGIQYTLFVGLMDQVGSFHVELAVPEPSLALLALALSPWLALRVRPRACR